MSLDQNTGKGRWNLTLAVAVLCEHTLFLLHDVHDNRFLGWVSKYCAKGNWTVSCKVFFFNFIFPLNWDLESRNVEMLSWKDMFRKVFKVTLPQKSKLISNLLIRQAQTRVSHLHYDQYCYYELFIWQNSNWNRVFTVSSDLKTHEDLYSVGEIFTN